MFDATPSFTPEQAGEIVSLAAELERRGPSEHLTVEQVRQLASEFGISEAALGTALQAWRLDRDQRLAAAAMTRRREARRLRRIGRFRRHASTYGVVVVGLFLLDWMSGPGWWAYWIAVPWGILVILQGLRVRSLSRTPGGDVITSI